MAVTKTSTGTRRVRSAEAGLRTSSDTRGSVGDRQSPTFPANDHGPRALRANPSEGFIPQTRVPVTWI